MMTVGQRPIGKWIMKIKNILFSLRTKNSPEISNLDVRSFLTRRLKAFEKNLRRKWQLEGEYDTKEI